MFVLHLVSALLALTHLHLFVPRFHHPPDIKPSFSCQSPYYPQPPPPPAPPPSHPLSSFTPFSSLSLFFIRFLLLLIYPSPLRFLSLCLSVCPCVSPPSPSDCLWECPPTPHPPTTSSPLSVLYKIKHWLLLFSFSILVIIMNWWDVLLLYLLVVCSWHVTEWCMACVHLALWTRCVCVEILMYNVSRTHSCLYLCM